MFGCSGVSWIDDGLQQPGDWKLARQASRRFDQPGQISGLPSTRHPPLKHVKFDQSQTLDFHAPFYYSISLSELVIGHALMGAWGLH